MKSSLLPFLLATVAGKVVEKEVCVIGGGAAGAYTAYELQKRGYNTVLFEPQSDLGGNCEILEYPSKINPGTNYTVNAAVILFSPKPVVVDFFTEFDAEFMPLSVAGQLDQSFIFGPGFTVPAPPADPLITQAALLNYTAIVNSPPYIGIADISLLPNWDNLSPVQRDALLEPFADFATRNPGIMPLRPLISQVMQGFGFVDTRPMWEILAYGGPTFLTQLVTGSFLQLINGCQDIYNELGVRMLAADPTSLQLSTYVENIKRRAGPGDVTMTARKRSLPKNIKNIKTKGKKSTTVSDDSKTNYKCDDAIMAFRPNGIGNSLLKDITADEQEFFDDLGYNGYIPSVWEMDLGPNLSAAGASLTQSLRFLNFQPVDVGIVAISKDRQEADYPWVLFYQPGEPADTPEKLQAIQDRIATDLDNIGFINIKNLFIKNHVYAVKPQTEANTLRWTSFFSQANANGDHLYWTGSVPGGEASENVWQYSLEILNNNFPAKSS